jgi:hypothetical protein
MPTENPGIRVLQVDRDAVGCVFDNGLWTIADDYTVKVALGSFAEDSPTRGLYPIIMGG